VPFAKVGQISYPCTLDVEVSDTSKSKIAGLRESARDSGGANVPSMGKRKKVRFIIDNNR